MPCYNYARFLPPCLNSILSQHVDLRVLVLDDCSSDNTPDVASSFARSDPRIEYRRHEANIGHIQTYNEGLEWSSGDLTLLMSADDMLTPGSLERAATFMEQNPSAGMVYGRVVKLQSGDTPPAPEAGCHGGDRLVPGQEWIAQRCAAGMNVIYSPEAITRTSLQKELGGYDPKLPHTADLEMWLRFASVSHVGVLDADQAYYRIHGSNMHATQFSSKLKQLEQVCLAFDTAFENYGERIYDLEKRMSRTHFKIASEAIRMASVAIDQKDALDNNWRDAISFAVRIYPKIRTRRVYWGLQRRALPGLNLISRLIAHRRSADYDKE